MIERLLPVAATLLARTLRLHWTGDTLPDRAVIMFWHGKMFAGWFATRKRKPVALVSQSKDGRFLASVLTAWKYKLVRGSSGKQGMEALSEAIAAVRSNGSDTIVITPDGPRGPYHQFKRGAFIAALELELPLYMLSVRYQSPFRFMRSWDKFELPLPFSRVSVEAIRVEMRDFPMGDVESQKLWLAEVSNRFSD